MARVTKQGVTRAMTAAPRGVRRLVRVRAGEPGVQMLRPGPVEGKQSIRRLIKRNPADGLSMPEADAITTAHTDVGSPGGYRGAVKVFQKPKMPPTTKSGIKTVKPPRLRQLRKR